MPWCPTLVASDRGRRARVVLELEPGIDVEGATEHVQLAAVAIEHQGEMHSNDSDFGRFPGLRWVNPLDRG